MDAKTFVAPNGERLIVLPEAEFVKLVDAAEDAAEIAAYDAFQRKLAAGDEELIPAAIVNRILDGDHPLRVWREHRGLTAKDLAAAAGIAQPLLSQIETGEREGTIDTLRKLAQALNLTIDDLVG